MATNYESIESSTPDYGQDSPQDALVGLREFMGSDNIAADLDDDDLQRIGHKVVEEFKIDKNSRSAWEKMQHDAMKLAMQVTEPKMYPWPNAANIKYPLLTTAAIQFAARAYPAIVSGPTMVKSRVLGKDEDGKKAARGLRVAKHMSWQLSDEMEEWEEETDKLLHILPISGMAYRKTYFDPSLGRNVSLLCTAEMVVVNEGCRDLATTPRITHILDPFPPNVIRERVLQGLWLEHEYGRPQDSDSDEDAPHEFLEQHRRLDLDEDGYFEPYIVTVHKDTSQVVRIIANFKQRHITINKDGAVIKIDREEIFTPFSFLPNPQGGWHGIGFGYLMLPLNEAVNTTLNQMLDAGHLQVAGGGFIGRGARLKGGRLKQRMGQWTPVDVSGGNLRENMVAFDHPGPSPVLFQLLGLLIEAAQDISSVKDIMTGEGQGKNASPTTTLALIEQGTAVFSAIYKRVYRSLRKEYKKIYLLNAQYLDEEKYFILMDEKESVGPEDYETEDLDIVPEADPSTVTNMQRLGRAQFLQQFNGDPDFESIALKRRLLEAASIPDVDELLKKEPAPDPEVLKGADEIDIKKKDQEIKGKLAENTIRKTEAEIANMERDDRMGDEAERSLQVDRDNAEASNKMKLERDKSESARAAADNKMAIDRDVAENNMKIATDKANAEIAAKKELAAVHTEDAHHTETHRPEPVNLNVQVGGEKKKITFHRDKNDRLSGADIEEG